MKKNIIVYTALTGSRDLLREPVCRRSNYQFVCFTDRYCKIKGWSQVLIRGNGEPRRLAREYKILSHNLLSEFEISVWQDASMTLVGELEPLIEQLGNSHIGAFPHRWRSCLYEEADHCIATQKDNELVIRSQMDLYGRMGFPRNFGLWETGILVRRNSRSVARVNDVWWHEVNSYSVRDQLSFSYSLWSTRTSCATFYGSVEDNQMFDFDICNHNRNMRDILAQEDMGVPIDRICALYGIDEAAVIRWKRKCGKSTLQRVK